MSKEDKGVRYSPELWEAIRREWEENTKLSYAKAAARGAAIMGEDAPTTSAVKSYALRNRWHRGGHVQVATVSVSKVTEKTVKRHQKDMAAILRDMSASGSAENGDAGHVQNDESGHVQDAPGSELNPKQLRFVDEYLIDSNGTRAVIRAGYAKNSAQQQASWLLSNPKVAAEIKRRQALLAAKVEITHEMILKRFWDIATADPNELSQYRRENCRRCWGIGHAYQWTELEYENACDRAREDGEDMPSNEGGMNFDQTRAPHPDCPECSGEGRGRVFITDTRHLSPAARALYAGVELGKDGIKVRAHNQIEALNAVGRHLGFFKDKMEVEIKDFNTAELAEKYGKAMAESRRRHQAMLDDRKNGDKG